MLNSVDAGNAQPRVDVVFTPNKYVLLGSTSIAGAISLTPVGFEGVGSGEGRLFFFAPDNSGSMTREMRESFVRGCASALDNLQPDDEFVIYYWDDFAYKLFPEERARGFLFDMGLRKRPNPVVAKATAENIRAAKAALQPLRQSSSTGTCMSTILNRMAEDLQSLNREEAVAVMITDGGNNAKDERAFARSLSHIAALRDAGLWLKVYAIAVGEEPVPTQLDEIAEACQAPKFFAIRSSAGNDVWQDTIAKIIEGFSAKRLRDVTIRFFQKANSANLVSFSQAQPTMQDFTSSIQLIGNKDVGEECVIKLGSWSVDDGDTLQEQLMMYEFEIRKLKADSLRVCLIEISFRFGGKTVKLEPLPVDASWTMDASLSEQIDLNLLRGKGLDGSAKAMQAGAVALKAKDFAVAREHFQKAYDIALEVNDQQFIDTIQKYVNVDASGQVSFKPTAYDETNIAISDSFNGRVLPRSAVEDKQKT